MAIPSGTDVEYVGSSGSGGVCVGQSASELVGFYGTAPIAQPSVSAIGTTTISQVATSGKWAFASSTAAVAFVARVRAIQDKLDALGIVVEA